MKLMTQPQQVVLETERLVLRPWKISDLNDLYEYASVDGVGQMAGWLPHQTIDESKKILDLFIKNKKNWAIVYKEHNKVIGSIGIKPLDDKDLLSQQLTGGELGYVLSKDYWGKGLMPEAVQGLIDYCFYELNFNVLTCGFFKHNTQSKRVAEKCGFQFYKYSKIFTRYDVWEPSILTILYHPEQRKNY